MNNISLFPSSSLVPVTTNRWQLRCERTIYIRNLDNIGYETARVSNFGIMSLNASPLFHIQFSIDGALFVNHVQNIMSFAINSDRTMACLFLRMGSVVWTRNAVEVFAYNANGGHKLTKIHSDQMQIHNVNQSYAFILDNDWYRRCETFDLTDTSPKNVFYSGSVYGYDCVPACVRIVNRGKRLSRPSPTWVINKIKIVKCGNSDVIMIHLDQNCIRVKVTNSGIIVIDIPGFYCCASMSYGGSEHLYVKCGNRRVYYDGDVFAAKFGGNSISYDGDDNFIGRRHVEQE